MGATGGKREGQKRETSLLLAQFYSWNFCHLDSPTVLVLMRAKCNTFALELMGLDVYRAPGRLSSPDTEISSSLSKHIAKVMGPQRLEMAPVSSLSLLVSWWGALFFGLLQNPSTHNPTLTRVSKGQIDFWWISTNCFHWMIRIAFLSNSECYSGMGLKLKNLVVANILSYSGRGNNTSYRCLCSSRLSLDHEFLSVGHGNVLLGACDAFSVRYFHLSVFVWKRHKWEEKQQFLIYLIIRLLTEQFKIKNKTQQYGLTLLSSNRPGLLISECSVIVRSYEILFSCLWCCCWLEHPSKSDMCFITGVWTNKATSVDVSKKDFCCIILILLISLFLNLWKSYAAIISFQSVMRQFTRSVSIKL